MVSQLYEKYSRWIWLLISSNLLVQHVSDFPYKGKMQYIQINHRSLSNFSQFPMIFLYVFWQILDASLKKAITGTRPLDEVGLYMYIT